MGQFAASFMQKGGHALEVKASTKAGIDAIKQQFAKELTGFDQPSAALLSESKRRPDDDTRARLAARGGNARPCLRNSDRTPRCRSPCGAGSRSSTSRQRCRSKLLALAPTWTEERTLTSESRGSVSRGIDAVSFAPMPSGRASVMASAHPNAAIQHLITFLPSARNSVLDGLQCLKIARRTHLLRGLMLNRLQPARDRRSPARPTQQESTSRSTIV